MTTFRVGDRVRIRDAYKSIPAGTMGTVQRLVSDRLVVASDHAPSSPPSTLYSHRFDKAVEDHPKLIEPYRRRDTGLFRPNDYPDNTINGYLARLDAEKEAGQ